MSSGARSGKGRFPSGEDDRESAFLDTLQLTEQYLGHYYGFDSATSAADYTIDEASRARLASGGRNPRAGVYLLKESGPASAETEEGGGSQQDSLFVGVYFSKEIKTRIIEAPPLQALSPQNLDAFSVLVEELSHFHLIRQRGAQEREVSRLELEWQAEIDKVLVPSLILREQTGLSHISPLIQAVFEQTTIDPTPPYPEAHKLAEKFWRQAFKEGIGRSVPVTDEGFRRFMARNYHLPIQEKSPFSPGAAYRPDKKTKRYAAAANQGLYKRNSN